jgi:hypothetical protein
MAGDVGKGPAPGTHLVAAQGVPSGQTDTGHAQLRAHRAL